MTKKVIINKINAIIKDFGSFTTGDIMAESSPCVGTLGGTTQLLERFHVGCATAISYDKQDNEVDETTIPFEDLKKDVLQEVLKLAKEYKTQQEEE